MFIKEVDDFLSKKFSLEIFLMANYFEFYILAIICSIFSDYRTVSGLMMAIVNGRFICLGNKAYSILEAII